MNKTEVEADSVIIDPVEGRRLLDLLDGLPLAIAQAGAYLQESGVGVGIYLKFYEQKWKELMESHDLRDAPLQDYPNRSVWTTWTISYNAIREKDQNAANLLLLWAFLDNRDLWHGLFIEACRDSTIVARRLSEWIGDIASSELQFIKAIQLLRNYSLVEKMEDMVSYTTHPVVHRWAYHFQGEDSREELAQLAVVVIGYAASDCLSRYYSTMQRRLLLHAEVCSRWVLSGEMERKAISRGMDEVDFDETEKQETILEAIHLLGYLYSEQGKLAEAEKMYERALRGREEVLGTRHTATLDTVHNLGLLYADQGKLAEAEKMYERALRGYEDVIGLENVGTYRPALNTMYNRGILYVKQGELTQAREAYSRALMGYEIILGPSNDECQEAKAALESLDLPHEGSSVRSFGSYRCAGVHTQTESQL